MVTNNKLIIKTQSQLTPSTEAFELLKHVGFVRVYTGNKPTGPYYPHGRGPY